MTRDTMHSIATVAEALKRTEPHSSATPNVGILPAISAVEWRWLGIMTVFILLLTQGPPTVQRLFGPADRVHVGTYWYHTDFSAYRAAMLEGATSPSWLIHNPATAEEHHPALMFPLYVTIGKAAAATGLPVLAVFAAVETLTRLLLPLSLYVFVATFLSRVGARRLAFVLAAFSAGLTLLLVPLLESFGISTTLGGQPSVQVVTFALFFTAPHLGLGLVMTLTAMVSFGAACRGSMRALVLLAFSVLALALLNHFNLPTVVSTFGIYTLARIVAERRNPARPLIACIVAGVAGGPLLLYNFVTFTLDPFWSKTHGEANTLPSPRPWELPMDYGVVFLVALVGIVVLAREWRARRQAGAATGEGASTGAIDEMIAPGVLVTWVAVAFVWMYVPLAYQHRLTFGLQPALAVLAAVGWPIALQWLRTGFRRLHLRASTARAAANSLLVIPAFSLPFTVYVALLISCVTNAPITLYAVDRDTYGVGEWIADHSGPDDVTAASVGTGEVLSGFLPGRVVIARPAGTIDYPEKKEMVDAMYRGQMSNAQLLDFLHENRVSFILVGPRERAIGPADPGAQLGLPVADRVGNAVAYRLSP